MVQRCFQQACKYSLEGIISKRTESPYLEKRTKDWLKVKCIHEQEFVIGGYTIPRSGVSREGFSALLLGFYKEGKLIYCGQVGTGFTEATFKETLLFI